MTKCSAVMSESLSDSDSPNIIKLTLMLECVRSFIKAMLRKGYLSLSTSPEDLTLGKYGHFSGLRGKYYPFDITIELTSRCNFSCSFCYKSSECGGEDIGFDQLQWIKTNLAGKVKEIRLMGGEPTIYPLFQDQQLSDRIELYESLLPVRWMSPYLGNPPARKELETLMPWYPVVRYQEHIQK